MTGSLVLTSVILSSIKCLQTVTPDFWTETPVFWSVTPTFLTFYMFPSFLNVILNYVSNLSKSTMIANFWLEMYFFL